MGRPYTGDVYIHTGAGHSWIAVVALVVVMGLRMYSMQRRRHGGRTGMSGSGRGFAAQGVSRSRPAPTPTDAAASEPGAFSGTAPGWFVDPFVRHEQRYWSGTAWTEHVTDNGSPSADPPPAPD